MLTQLRRAAEDLNELNAQWALVGALAVGVYTEPRTTRDIDVAVVVTGDAEQEDLFRLLHERGYRERQLLMHLAPTRRMGFRVAISSQSGASIALDLLFASSGIEPEIVSSANRIEILPELFVPVASRAHLIATKILSQNDSDRLRDRADLQQLMARMDLSELGTISEMLRLMEQRGFSRGKDLQANLIRDLEQFAPHVVPPSRR